MNGPFSVVSKTYDLTNTSPSPITWALFNTNNWLSVTSTNGTIAPGSISIFTVALTNANSLTNGTYSGSMWITNLSNGLAQQLAFSLAVNTADYPLPVTGYNLDVVVESNAVGGNTLNYANTFDPYCSFLSEPGPVCFYEDGLDVVNILENIGVIVPGLPPSGLFTSLEDGLTTFQLGSYDSNNVLYLASGAPSGSLVLTTPIACKSLSVLAASAQGGGNGTLVIHFADGSSSSNIAFNAANYLTTNSPGPGAAITNFGLLTTGYYNEFGTVDSYEVFPTFFQTAINLHSLGLDGQLITSVTFTMPASANTNLVTGVFALSGTEAVYTGDYNLSVMASPANGGVLGGGGAFPAGSTNTVTATANSHFVFANWTENGVIVSTSSNYPVVLNSDETLVANFTTYYTLSNTVSPSDGGTVSAGGTYLQGASVYVTATNNNGFEFTGWTGDATGTENPLFVTITTNLNITANFASNSANITWTVLTNVPAYGKVTPNLNGKVLTANHNYTLTATALAGNVFSNWTGTITSTKNPLTIKAESNMVIQANFVPNPFLLVKGTYNGLFFDSINGVTEQTAGMLKGLSLTQKGTYSGTLLLNGASHGISGSFNLAGQATNQIVRTAALGGTVTLVMTNENGPPPQVTGSVTGTNIGIPWVAALIADRATNTVPSAEYTLLIPPDANSAPPNSHRAATVMP